MRQVKTIVPKKGREPKRRKKEITPFDNYRATEQAKKGKCNYKRKDGTFCKYHAGWGTDHLGMGRCRHHGGTLPAANAKAIKEEAIFMGSPKEINPIDAIMWCIHMTAGEIEWLSMQIADVDSEDKWYEHTVVGRQMHILQRTRADAQDRLVRYSKDALALGLAERAVRLAEQYGSTIAHLLNGIRRDLMLNAQQEERWPVIVRKHLILLEGGLPEQAPAPLAALPRRTGEAR